EPGHYRFTPHVRVDREGYKREVSTNDMPQTSPDLAACTRVVLHDMTIPSSILNSPPSEDAVETMNRSYMGSPLVVVGLVEAAEIVLVMGAITIAYAVAVEVAGESGD